MERRERQGKVVCLFGWVGDRLEGFACAGRLSGFAQLFHFYCSCFVLFVCVLHLGSFFLSLLLSLSLCFYSVFS